MGSSRVTELTTQALFLAALLPGALSASDPQTIFPSDGEDPRKAGGRELLEVVCKGHVVLGKTMKCSTGCARYTDFGRFGDTEFDWSLVRVTRGHFLSPTSEDAVLWMEGCESHASNWGGTLLLTREADRWKKVWYRSGLVTDQCHKVALVDGREILVCIGRAAAQGNVGTDLYVEDLLHPTEVLMADKGDAAFFGLYDDTLTCGDGQGRTFRADPITRAFIQKVEFKSDGKELSVTAAHGKRRMTKEDAAACEAEGGPGNKRTSRFLPPVKTYQIDFVFDGHTYKIAPGSEAAARVFQWR